MDPVTRRRRRMARHNVSGDIFPEDAETAKRNRDWRFVGIFSIAVAILIGFIMANMPAPSPPTADIYGQDKADGARYRELMQDRRQMEQDLHRHKEMQRLRDRNH